MMNTTTEEVGDRPDRSTECDAAFDAWVHHSQDEVERWAAAGWDLRVAFVWQRAGFDPSDAHAWSDVIESRQAADPRPASDPGKWWTPTALIADHARACVAAGFAPADYDEMAAVFGDPSDDRDWLDADFSVLEGGEWGCALTVDTAQDAMQWRSAGWNVAEACDLEATLMHVIGYQTLFAPGGQAALTDACAAWRDTSLDPRRAITCVQAGLTAEEAECMTWDDETTAAVQTLAGLLAPCLQQ